MGRVVVRPAVVGCRAIGAGVLFAGRYGPGHKGPGRLEGGSPGSNQADLKSA
jgi:hypothetical protein